MTPCDVRPYQLLCLVCALGRDDTPDGRVGALLAAVRARPDRPLTLRCNVDSVYSYQNPGSADDTPEGALFNVKRDLDVLQRLGLTPGATRPARQLLQRLLQAVETVQGICGYATVTAAAWQGCPRAGSGDYERGRAAGLAAIIPPRDAADKARVKIASAAAVDAAEALRLRPHHLMCMACFHAGQSTLAPIAEDNLYEAIAAMQRRPEIPVTLVRGCCMICPPCSQFDPASGRCIAASGMSLRDEKKDLDLLQRLGLAYGDTRPARELYARLFRAVRSTVEICGNGDGIVRGWEWSVCGGPDGHDGYRRARASGMGIVPSLIED